MKDVLIVKNLTKYYDSFLAVDNVSFSVKESEIVGLLGPNGAGKTTIINMILGVLEPDRGEIEVLGKNFKTHKAEIMQRINFAATYCNLPGNMTVYQNLYFFGMLYNVDDLKSKIERLIGEFELENFVDKKVGLLSSGEVAKVNLVKAFINSPKLFLLDEPTASLDPSIAKNVREKVVKKVKEEKISVLWASHNMTEVETVCERVLFILHGRILISGSPKELPESYNKKNLEELFIYLAKENFVLEKEL